MANTSLTPVTFHGATLITVSIDGVAHVALKPICDAIGVQWMAQLKRIKRHPVLSEAMSVMDLPSNGGDQQTVCLPLDKLNGWLFGVTASRTRPEIRERLIQYQRECFDVLAGHFMPQALTQAAQNKLLQTAVLNGVTAGTMVQQRVTQAIINGDDWKHHRWLVSFVTDSKLGSPPVVERLAPDTLVLTKSELIELMSTISADAWSHMRDKANSQGKMQAVITGIQS